MGKKLESWVIAFLVVSGFSSISFVIGVFIAQFTSEPVIPPAWAIVVIGVGYLVVCYLLAWMVATDLDKEKNG